MTAVEFDLEDCPLDIELLPGQASGGGGQAEGQRVGGDDDAQQQQQQQDQRAYTVFYPDRLADELLRWLGSGAFCADPGTCLQFPPTLSKQERARWHHMAERRGLHTESHGVGDERFLTVAPAAAAAPRVSAKLSEAQRQRARAIYTATQFEGGRFWSFSHREIEQVVASGEELPPDLQAVVDKW